MQRPSRIVFTCADFGLSVDHVRWSSWGGKVAVGRGIYRYNDCQPDCADGTEHAQPATVRLYRRRACPGRSHLYYQSATVVAAGRRHGLSVGCPSI